MINLFRTLLHRPKLPDPLRQLDRSRCRPQAASLGFAVGHSTLPSHNLHGHHPLIAALSLALTLGVGGLTAAQEPETDSPSSATSKVERVLEQLRNGASSPPSELIEQAEAALRTLAGTPDLDDEAEIHNHLSWLLSSRGEPQAGLEHAQRALDRAHAANNQAQTATAEYHIAVALWYLSRGDEALEHGAASLRLREQLGDSKGRARVHTLLGAIHRARGHYPAAIGEHVRALRLSEVDDDQAGIARSNNNLGLIHWNLDNYDEAKAHLQNALAHYRSTGDKSLQASVLSNLGLVEIELKRPSEALELLRESLELSEELDLPRTRARVIGNLAFAHEELHNYTVALEHLETTLQLRREFDDLLGVARALGSIAGVQVKLGDVEAAERNYKEALEAAQAAGGRSEHETVLTELAALYEQQARYQEALMASRQATAMTDEIGKDEARLKMAKIESDRQLALKQMELDRQAQQQRLLLLGGLFAVLTAGLLLLYARSRGRLLRQVQASHDALAKTTERLSESETHYRNLFNDKVIPKLLIALDSDEVLDLNSPGQALLTADPGAGNRTLEKLQPDWLRRAAVQSRDLADDAVCVNEVWQTPEGLERHAQIWLSPTTLDGRPCALLTVHDVTEDKRLEGERIRVNKLGSLGVLAGGIAHDFNNALMAILGNVSMVKFEAASNSSVEESLTAAERAVEDAAELTSSLVVFAKGGEPRRNPHNLSRMLPEAARFAASGTSASVRLDVADDLWSEVDRSQFKQLISNLVLNGLQAAGEEGTVVVRAQVHQAHEPLSSTAGAGEYVQIEVEDDGDGIPPDVLDRVFDPYFSTKPASSGLGLASAFAITTRHQGWVEALSQPGGGALFRVYLPTCEPAPSQPRSTTDVPQSNRAQNVLVMDDDDSVREVFRSALEHFGYQTTLVSCGEDAVLAYSEALNDGKRFDVVVLDLTVPGGMGGKRTIEVLQEIDPDVLAIVASGYSNDPVMSDHASFGFRAALSKPFSLGALESALQQVMNKTELITHE